VLEAADSPSSQETAEGYIVEFDYFLRLTQPKPTFSTQRRSWERFKQRCRMHRLMKATKAAKYGGPGDIILHNYAWSIAHYWVDEFHTDGWWLDLARSKLSIVQTLLNAGVLSDAARAKLCGR